MPFLHIELLPNLLVVLLPCPALLSWAILDIFQVEAVLFQVGRAHIAPGLEVIPPPPQLP